MSRWITQQEASDLAEAYKLCLFWLQFVGWGCASAGAIGGLLELVL